MLFLQGLSLPKPGKKGKHKSLHRASICWPAEALQDFMALQVSNPLKLRDLPPVPSFPKP